MATIYGTDNGETLNGTAEAETIFALGGDDTIFALGGHDTIYAGGGNDTIFTGYGDDYVFGAAGDDRLFGYEGNDFLDGGTGNDFMDGGNGDDDYFVDSLGDTVVEQSSHGNDVVITLVNNYTLSANVEDLQLGIGLSDVLNGTGNELNNFVRGNEFNNLIFGLGGNDNIEGREGNDALIGGFGNDRLTGGDNDDYLNGYGKTVTDESQFDQLSGGAGSDVFVLGDRRSAYYVESGDGYAIILDWQAGKDSIQAKAGSKNYQLNYKSLSGIGSSAKDTEIFYIDGAGNRDRIGIVQDSTKVSLSRDFKFLA